jgi:hypothetical protein
MVDGKTRTCTSNMTTPHCTLPQIIQNWLWRVNWMLAGWNIALKNQCPDLPDPNVCNLHFFPTLQSEQWKLPSAKDTYELIERVQEAFAALDL